MDKWFKDILPDKDPYHNRGRDQMRKKGGPEFECLWSNAGADPGFQVRGGALKKFAPSGGRREHFWGISCEKSRFYANKSYFFVIAEGGANVFGVFRVKNHDFTPTNHIFL